MKKNLFFLISCFSIIILTAQTPQYYNYQGTEGANSFPFSISPGKEVQWLFNPHEFNHPSLAPSGYIDTLYFYMTGTNATHAFFLFTIKMGLTTLTSLPPGIIYAGPLDTVLYEYEDSLTSSPNTWMPIALQHPFAYDSSKSLIIDVYNCGYLYGNGDMLVNQHSLTGKRRCYISIGTNCDPVYSGQDSLIVHCGVHISKLIGIQQKGSDLPLNYALYQNYPNPFNPSTKIKFDIRLPLLPLAAKESTVVVLKVYDILGREVATLVNQKLEAGTYEVQFIGTNYPSGVYFYRLSAPDFSETKKLLLLK